MLKLSKKTKYALMAMKYLALQNNGNFATAKQISDNYNIPYELVAKVLQKLKKLELIESFQGIKGGYKLNKIPSSISLLQIISAIEPNYQITECLSHEDSVNNCTHLNCCQIRNPLAKLQKEIDNLFNNTTLDKII